MNAQTLLNEFDLIAEAPGGVLKLRQLILQLAIRGRLVPHNPKEGLSEAELKELRPPENEPYPIPENWRWTTLRSISKELGQKVPDAPFSYIDVSAIDSEKGCIGEQVQILEPANAPSRARKLVDLGTVIYSTVRPYLLNIAVVEQAFEPAPIVSTAFFVMHPFKGVASRFLFHYLRSDSFTTYVQGAMTGMAYPAINDAKMSVAPFPLPPLAEQKRIIARVDELMKRCDDLEARQNDRNERRTVMTAACLHAITTKPRISAASEIRRVLDSFPLLIDTPESVAELRKTILQLAVQGRLAPQDPKDESVTVLKTAIEAERDRLRESARIKKDAALPPISRDAMPYSVPESWMIVRLGYLMSRIGSGSTPRGGRSTYVTSGVPFIRSQNVWDDGLHLDDVAYITRETHEQMNGTHVIPGDILLNITGASLGRCAVVLPVLKEANVSQHVSILRPVLKSMTSFLHLAILSPLMQDLIWKRQVGMAREGLSKKVLELFEFPLPPLPEQKRIVAKVNKLMLLCDALEAKLAKSRGNADILAAAIVHEMCNGAYRREAIV